MTASLDQVRASLTALLPRLRRFARTITRDHDDADELVLVCIAHVLQRFEQWRPESRFESWVFGIMRNAWLDEVRAKQSHRGVLVPVEGEGQSEVRSIRSAISALPEEQRMAVALVLIEGLSYKEAAEALEIAVPTLATRLARGREALQALL